MNGGMKSSGSKEDINIAGLRSLLPRKPHTPG